MSKFSLWEKWIHDMKISKGQRQYIIFLLLIGMIGIGFIVFSNALAESVRNNQAITQTQEASEVIGKANVGDNAQDHAENILENQLASILSEIDGVGEVQVKITVATTIEKEYATNSKIVEKQTTESTESGGNKVIHEVQQDEVLVMRSISQGTDEPVVVKEKKPEVIGALVVASGANDVKVQEQLSSAVQTILNLPAHKVVVLPKK